MKLLSAAIIVVALAVGVGLRVTHLDGVPAGFGQDEACDGYDAYSILKTGRDHHGNFMPIVMQGFNDYRMPLFQYSLVPLVGAFGLKVSVVRLGSALWGIIDLIAITLAAGLLLGWPGAAAAAVIGALMPWHIEISRYGIEATAASAFVSMAVACFLVWLERRRDLWLMLTGVCFGLSFYTYAITKALLPPLIGLMVVLYWHELKQVRAKALIAGSIVFILVLPQAIMLVQSDAKMQEEYKHLSLFNAETVCPGCDSADTKLALQSIPYLLVANFASNFTPSFLFTKGDRGDHWTMLHPRGFGELLPEQAIFILLAALAFFDSNRRRAAILLAGWLLFAVLPAALIQPLGAGFPDPDPNVPPTPNILSNYHLAKAPITPSLLLNHPDMRHSVLAMAPWVLLSALGFVVLMDLLRSKTLIRNCAISLLALGVIYHCTRYIHFYFEDFPVFAAPYFQYGIREALQVADQHGSDLPVVISPRINQPYIYVLFFQKFPPAEFQADKLRQQGGIFGYIYHFDRYYVASPTWAYAWLEHGIFISRGVDKPPMPPEALIHYPDGSVAFQIVVK